MQDRSASLARLRADLGSQLRPADAIEAPAPSAAQFVQTGLAALDAALGGGLPRGRLVEASGAGRTTLGLRVAARLTQRGGLVAWIEATPAFDARSAVHAGVDSKRLLLVRAQALRAALRAADITLAGGGFDLVVLDRMGAKGRVSDSAWVRLTRRGEKTRAAMLLLTEGAEAGSFAAASLHLTRRSHGEPNRTGLAGKIFACAEVIRAKRHEQRPLRIELALELPNIVGRGT